MKKDKPKKHFATVEELDAAISNRDGEAFAILRLHYRRHFDDGYSDAAFLKWCADMVKKSARESIYKVTP